MRRKATTTQLQEGEDWGYQDNLRMEELTERFRGLAIDMQAQARRVDLLDDKLKEWHASFEEVLRQKHVDFAQDVERLGSGICAVNASVEEMHRRHQRILRERSLEEGTREPLTSVRSRLEAVEAATAALTARFQEVAPASSHAATAATSAGHEADAAVLAPLEQQLWELAEGIGGARQDTRDVRERLAAQGEQLRSLRTIVEAREGYWRSLCERVEKANWEDRIDQVQQALHEEIRRKGEHGDRLELLSRRLDDQEQACELLRASSHATACLRGSPRAWLPPPVAEQILGLAPRVLELEEAVLELRSGYHETGDLGARIGALLAQLRELAPRVIRQEEAADKAETRVAVLTAKVNELSVGLAALAGDNLEMRLGRVEDNVHQLKSGRGLRVDEAKLVSAKDVVASPQYSEFHNLVTKVREQGESIDELKSRLALTITAL